MRTCYDGPIDTDWGAIGKPAWNAMYLYLLSAGDDELLYVGITWNVKSRWQQHRLKKEWWPEVARVEVREYTAQDAVTALLEVRKEERRLISALEPTRNIHRPRKGAR